MFGHFAYSFDPFQRQQLYTYSEKFFNSNKIIKNTNVPSTNYHNCGKVINPLSPTKLCNNNTNNNAYHYNTIAQAQWYFCCHDKRQQVVLQVN